MCFPPSLGSVSKSGRDPHCHPKLPPKSESVSQAPFALMAVFHFLAVVSFAVVQVHRLLCGSPVEAIRSVSHSRMSSNVRFPPKVFKSAM